MNYLFFRDQIRDNPAFLSELLVFNKTPLTLKLDVSDKALRDRILADRALCAVLHKRGLAESDTGAISAGYWSFTDDCQRLALLAPENLRHVGMLLAAAIYADDIASSVTKRDVLAAREFLGEELYGWALNRGRFELSDKARSKLKAALPADMALAERISLMSRLVLEMLRSSWPEALRAKTGQLFNSINLPELPDALRENMPASRKLWFIVKKLVLRETVAEWTHYFK
jgi:hypothetical protein